MHRLISEPRLYIDGLSGTSAGAMNAVVFAAGFIKGSRQGAINALAEFWGRVAERCTVPRSAMSRLFGAANAWQVDSEPGFMMFDFMTRIWSPSQLNPSSAKPLRETAAISAIRRSIR
ncbi:MAG: esterase [Rhodospirillales bacterium]|jgi:NTE family protein|nr:esterase [Rhodospirillales bacterium]